ncbi:MAG: DUF2911 domain-containing protein [Gemmatimonadetes bacterium]|nr:DUF2911 domain-containing protein [Gemmatimonadota bacterium]
MTTWLILLAAVVQAQTPVPGCARRGDAAALAARPSPLDSAQVTVAGAVLKVCYGRPSVRGRQVAGELVPYGQPWRLGANEPTTLHLPVAVEIAGVRVAPGSYSLYVVASELRAAEREWHRVGGGVGEAQGADSDPAAGGLVSRPMGVRPCARCSSARAADERVSWRALH